MESMLTRVQILVLGAGWTSAFVKALCDAEDISYAATSRSGRDSTIPFIFDPDSDDISPYMILPTTRTLLITFPITTKGASERLIRLYGQTHGLDSADNENKTRFIQLGTTGIWDGRQLRDGSSTLPTHNWFDRQSPFTRTPRAEAEEELLAMSRLFPTTVLNLAGLWGGTRSPKNWVDKIASSKEALKAKGSIHLIHGVDVARAVIAIHRRFDRAEGQRWILSDGRVYDWWDLASAWGSRGSGTDEAQSSMPEDRSPQRIWVRELMEEEGIRALPRNVELLGRALDSRDFWRTFDLSPLHARIEA
ncbi:hypothetical protein BDN70DRAFT_858211 [Pholiota conissans]|uniref:Uncharacterized protein n=1 Tax=Pholiota conissans TaxID=109636 RepID=A0A9P5Z489_9AGAR|nr:hypothetical protein BDN70DRAFT_858211 [Pholiota conissans]